MTGDKLTPVDSTDRSRINLSDEARRAFVDAVKLALAGLKVTGRVLVEVDVNQSVFCDALLVEKRKANK